MTNIDEPEYISIARLAIERTSYKNRSDNSNDVLDSYKRLFSSTDALLAWKKLYSKNKISIENHFNIAGRKKEAIWFFITMEIANTFHYSHVPKSQRLTEVKIKDSAHQAAKKAKELAHLINDSFNLESISLSDCLTDTEQKGLATSIALYGRYFYELNKSEQTEYAEQYKVLSHILLSQDLKDILWRFAALAEKTAEFKPIAPRPTIDNLPAQIFCNAVCGHFKYVYGSPCTEIAAAFASAIFNNDFSNDTVKSWWNRHNKPTINHKVHL